MTCGTLLSSDCMLVLKWVGSTAELLGILLLLLVSGGVYVDGGKIDADVVLVGEGS